MGSTGCAGGNTYNPQPLKENLAESLYYYHFLHTAALMQKIDQTNSVLPNSASGDGGLLSIIKIGGNIVDDEAKLSLFLKDFAAIDGHKILVHGGGKVATQIALQLGIEQQMIEGRRVTDAETLKVVTMVYTGLINKNIVCQLQASGCNAIGLSGADGNLIVAHKRVSKTDYGFAGDIDAVNEQMANGLLQQGLTLVIAPITHNGSGQLLNTNADTVAQELAKALSRSYTVQLIYSFEKAGVLLNADDESSVIKEINPHKYAALKTKGLVFAGMIPKLDNAFAALQSGVKKVIIGKAENLADLMKGESGTAIVHE